MKKASILDLGEELKSSQIGRLIPLAKWNQFHADPSVASLRYLYFTDRDGFRKCVLKRGNRLLVSEPLYLRWLRQQNEEAFERILEEDALNFDALRIGSSECSDSMAEPDTDASEGDE